MAEVYARYPQDREAIAFYALALQATAEPNDKTYAKQKNRPSWPRRSWPPSRIIPAPRTTSSTATTTRRWPSAASTPRAATTSSRRRCACAAMPSHIYVLLGMWPETIQGDITAAAAEKSRGNPDDHMHALDYLVYAYLQQGQDVEARKVLAEGRAIMADLAARKVESGRPTGHFAIAAMEARWAMERGQWQEAASIEPRPNRFAHTESMIYFARAIGAARTARRPRPGPMEKIAALRDALQQAKNTCWAEQVEIQRRGGGVGRPRRGQERRGPSLTRSAAELEEATEKHNITPGPIRHGARLLRRPPDGPRPAGAGRMRELRRGVARTGPRALQGASRSRARRRAGG